MKRARALILLSGLVLAVAVGVFLASTTAQAAACQWTGAVDTDWSTTGNWSGCLGAGTDEPPGSSDTATIPNLANLPVISATTTVTITGLTINTGGLVTANGTLTLGNLDGGGDLTITGTLNWTSGTMSGVGVTTIGPGGVLNISGSATKWHFRTINNNGTTTWGGGNINTDAVFNNLAGATFDTQSDAIFVSWSGAPQFNNTGTFTKSAGAGVTTIDIPFNNSATTTVSSGTLRLTRGGTISGPVTFAGAVLDFGGGTFNVTASSTLSGTTALFRGGTVNLVATYNVTDGTTVSGATANFTGSVVNVGANPLTISSGTANFSNTEGTVTTTVLTLSGGTLTGSANLTITGTLNWTSGTMSGVGVTTIGPSGVLNISGSATKWHFRTINNNGTTTWGGGSINTGGVFNNLAGATFDTQSDAIFVSWSGAPQFNNTGTFTKSAGAGVTTIDIPFNNSATTTVSSGTLRLTRGGTISGPVTFAGAVLDFGGGTFNVTASSTLSGTTALFRGGTVNLAGTYNVTDGTTVSGATANFTGSVVNVGANPLTISSGTANFSNTEGTVTTTVLTLSGGTLTGSANLNVTGTLNWTSGTMSGVGVTTIGPSGVLNISGSATKWHFRTINNNGTTTWGGGNINTDAVFNNLAGATFDTQSDAIFVSWSGAPQFNNTGTFTKSAGAGVTTIDIPFNNSATTTVSSGTLRLTRGYTQTAGALLLKGGDLSSTQVLNLQGGLLGGSGTVTASVTNGGQVSPGASTGVLTISGAYTQTAIGVLDIQIGGLETGTSFDQLNVTGAASLDGTLAVSLTSGFMPNGGNSFRVMTFASRSGDSRHRDQKRPDASSDRASRTSLRCQWPESGGVGPAFGRPLGDQDRIP